MRAPAWVVYLIDGQSRSRGFLEGLETRDADCKQRKPCETISARNCGPSGSGGGGTLVSNIL